MVFGVGEIETLCGLALLARLGLGQQDLVDAGQHTTVGNGYTAEQLAELLIVADGQLDVTGHNTGLLVIAGSVSSKLQDLSSQVLEDSSQVHRCTSSDSLSILALLEVPVDMLTLRRILPLSYHSGKFTSASIEAASKKCSLPCNTSHRELESGLGRPAHSLLSCSLSLAAARHDCRELEIEESCDERAGGMYESLESVLCC